MFQMTRIIANASVGEHLFSTAANLPEPNQSVPAQQRQERINHENISQT